MPDFSAFSCIMLLIISAFVGVMVYIAVKKSRGDGGPHWGE